ncbi:hypothetical protein [Mobilicoccus caccae]|nr:hypothetical protein [Mobilicoccus caccae]
MGPHRMEIPGAAARRFLWTSVAITGVLGVLSALAYLVLDRDTHGGLFDYFYVGTEMNLPTWWNVMLLAAIAVTATLAAAVFAAERLGWAAIAATACFLSLDEGSRLHENAGLAPAYLGLSVPTFAWVAVGAVVAPVGVLVLAFATRRLPRRTRRALAACVTVYIAAALGLEAVSGYVIEQGGWGTYLALTHIEEMLEMTACAFAVHAILARLLPLRVEAPGRGGPASRSAREVG